MTQSSEYSDPTFQSHLPGVMQPSKQLSRARNLKALKNQTQFGGFFVVGLTVFVDVNLRLKRWKWIRDFCNHVILY